MVCRRMLSAFHCWAHGGRSQLKKGPESCSLQEARKQVEQAATRKRAGRVGWGRLGCGSGGSEDYGVAPEGIRARGSVKGCSGAGFGQVHNGGEGGCSRKWVQQDSGVFRTAAEAVDSVKLRSYVTRRSKWRRRLAREMQAAV